MEESAGELTSLEAAERAVRIRFVGLLSGFTRRAADPVQPEGQAFLDLYSDRPCHGVERLHGWIRLLDEPEVREGLENARYCLTALMFCRSDIIGNGTNLQNRRRCVELLREVLLDPKDIVPIVERINATYNRYPFRRFGNDCDVMGDISNSMYGDTFEELERYWNQMRHEFILCYEEGRRRKAGAIFRQRQLRVLRRMLVQSQTFGIYRASYFQQRFEKCAAENIKQMLTMLTLRQ
jgi:hypothetical protein